MPSLIRLLCAALPFLLLSCTPPPLPSAGTTGRPGPDYIHWLEEQSSLRGAYGLLRIVSGSDIGWKHSANTKPLIESAPTWIAASPETAPWPRSRRQGLFPALTSHDIPNTLSQNGFDGFLISGAFISGQDWKGLRTQRTASTAPIGTEFSHTAGSEEEYEKFLHKLVLSGMHAGGQLLPSATAAGPDFTLAICNVRSYPSLFAMAELPADLWPLVPDVPEHSAGTGLPLSSIHPAAQGLVPLLADSETAGWAVTKPVTGVDGVTRRWTYRFYGSPETPVFHWDDPAGTARNLIEASLIRQAGLRHQALCTFSASAWFGLVPASTAKKTDETEPAFSAVRQLSRSAHRYGSALLLEDPVPPHQIPLMLETGADFLCDTIIQGPLDLALATADATPLAKALNAAVASGLDFRRLWHGAIPSSTNVPPLLLTEIPGKKHDGSQLHSLHLLKAAFQAFMPGLLVINAEDIHASMPEELDAPAMLIAGGDSTALPGIFEKQPPGFRLSVAEISPILKLRHSYGIAAGILREASASSGGCVLSVRISLPKGDVLFSANFSSLPQKSPSGAAIPPLGWTLHRNSS